MFQIGDVVRVRDPDFIPEYEFFVPERSDRYYYGIRKESLRDMSMFGEYVIESIVLRPEPYTGRFPGAVPRGYRIKPADDNPDRTTGCLFLENMLVAEEAEEVFAPDAADLFSFLLREGVEKC